MGPGFCRLLRLCQGAHHHLCCWVHALGCFFESPDILALNIRCRSCIFVSNLEPQACSTCFNATNPPPSLSASASTGSANCTLLQRSEQTAGSAAADWPAARAGATFVECGAGQLFLYGGFGGDGRPVNDGWVLDVTYHTWHCAYCGSPDLVGPAGRFSFMPQSFAACGSVVICKMRADRRYQ